MTTKRSFGARLAAFALAAASALPVSAANLVIFNFDGPGEGFNDPTAVAPVGGNPGLTLGQQRLNAFTYAASIWGAELQSATDIFIIARMDPLACTATGAVLGSAGPTNAFANFPGAPELNHWYHFALANKLAGVNLVPGFGMINARFNSNLGNPGCLTGSGFYLGLDNNHGTLIDLVSVLLHEFGHGLGFSTITNGQTGVYASGLPSIYDKFAFDNTAGKSWTQMTDAERAASAINPRNLVWTGANVTAAAPSVLVRGTPELTINAPKEVAGTYPVGVASFGPTLLEASVNKQVMQVVDQPNGTGLACTPLDAANTRAMKNRIALVDRGVCGFAIKAKMVQDAGAVAMIVVDNVAGDPPADMSGADPTLTIPSVRVTLATGNAIKAAMKDTPSGRSSGVVARLGVDTSQLAGADKAGRVMLFSPNPFQPGSSVSHWDTSAFRNLLMEPFINADLPHAVKAPQDLTKEMFKDIGW
jgi:hypothetical protein